MYCHAPSLCQRVTAFVCRQREQIFFSGRKGIIAIAIRAGVEIVPTYFLGQSQVRSASESEPGGVRVRVRVRVKLG